jgi:NAD(P)-dependent dehydrogenase (short-subunit alcohol dehydrogenase family)
MRTAVITGGAGGIGAATAERLAAKGFAVLVVDRDLAAAEAVAQRLGQPSSACAADVSNEDDVKRYVAAAIERYGRIDAFFNNAGIEGAILNTASQAGVRGVPGLSAYVASKHAVVGLSQGIALEVAAAGIRVNCLCPGPTNTRMMDDISDAVRAAGGDPASFVDRMPVGRFGEPAEIADVAAWVLSEAPPFMTGAVLTVDGAMTTP